MTPIPRSDQWWTDRHEACVAITKAGGFDVAFVGDSITQGWESTGKSTWDAHLKPLKAANFGFSGDRTQHVLWRLQNGELTGSSVKVVVVMIGTNNLGTDSPSNIADGIVAVVDSLLAKTKAEVLLLGIFPRSISPTHALRLDAAEATRLAFDRTRKPRVTQLNIGSAFVRSDGTLRTLLMPDALHLNSYGYEIWAKAIMPTLRRLLAQT